MIANTVTRRALAAATITFALFGTTACSDKSPSAPVAVIITQTVVKTATLFTLIATLTQAGLAATLDGEGPFTVFAPVNGALTALAGSVVTNLLATGNAAKLTKLLGYHVVSGRYAAASLTNGQVLTTVEGTQLTVSIAGGVVKVGGATVTTPHISASNGVMHLIDGVLLGSLDIVDQATVRGFSSLVTAASAAGLVTALRGGSTFGLTVFAATNAAFATIPGGAPSDPVTLASVLKLHVIGARALSTALTNGQKLTTLQGPQLTVGIATTITVAGPFNGAVVGPVDVIVNNFVIHVIDKVLLP